jgi:beta-phosphoglucomutase-like phosphatase (HAD superfamily)
VRVGVGSDMTADWQFRKLERLGLLDRIDFAVTSEEAGVEKPAPGFFALCLEKAGCAPGDEVRILGYAFTFETQEEEDIALADEENEDGDA